MRARQHGAANSFKGVAESQLRPSGTAECGEVFRVLQLIFPYLVFFPLVFGRRITTIGSWLTAQSGCNVRGSCFLLYAPILYIKRMYFV